MVAESTPAMRAASICHLPVPVNFRQHRALPSSAETSASSAVTLRCSSSLARAVVTVVATEEHWFDVCRRRACRVDLLRRSEGLTFSAAARPYSSLLHQSRPRSSHLFSRFVSEGPPDLDAMHWLNLGVHLARFPGGACAWVG